jgi:hypothetical protein
MGESYFSIELLRECNKAIEKSMSLVKNCIHAEGCGYNLDTSYSHIKIGIFVHFMFRNEADYSLFVPWEYCNSIHSVRDYYKRFKLQSDNVHLSEMGSFSESFADTELLEIRKGIV